LRLSDATERATSSSSMSAAEVLESALEAMPIFPLSGVVLFPGALMPLHVFEPRYRRMLADCLATHRIMAMAFVVGEGDKDDFAGTPNIARIAGAGLVVHHAALPDGRSNVVLQGCARVALEELPFVDPYRRARARVVADVMSPVSAVERTGLHAAATAFAASARLTDFELPAGITPWAAADLCAHHLVNDPQARQRVLEELDVAVRVRFVTTVLAEQMGLADRGTRGQPD
jgi:Lon protease-like protein